MDLNVAGGSRSAELLDPPPPGEGPRGRSRGVSRWAGAVALASAVLVLVLVVSLWPAGRSDAASGVLVSNLDDTGLLLGELELQSGHTAVQLFRTGGAPAGYRLDSVTVDFTRGGDASSLTVTLHRGSPTGRVVATLEGPGTIANNEQVTFVAPTGTVLQPDSVYALKMIGTAPSTDLALTTRNDPGVDAALEGWSIDNTLPRWLFAVNGGFGGGRLVSNTGQATDGGVSELGVVDVGQVFVTGSHEQGYLLDSVGVRLDVPAGSSSQVEASLHRVGAASTDAGVDLGSVVVDATGVVVFDEVPLGTVLVPDTGYVVLLEGLVGSSVTVAHVSSGGEDAGGGLGWSLADWHGRRPSSEAGSLAVNGFEGLVGVPLAVEVFGVASHLGGPSVTALGLEADGSPVGFDQGVFDAATAVYSASVPASQSAAIVDVEVADDTTGLRLTLVLPDRSERVLHFYDRSDLESGSFAVNEAFALELGRHVLRVEAFKGDVRVTYAVLVERSDTPEGLGAVAPELYFETLSRSVDESEGPQRVTVRLSHAVPYRVAVGVAAADGTAGPLDVVLADTTVIFEPGQTAKTVTLAPVDDGLIEPEETFTVQLGVRSGPAVVRPGASSFELTVVDAFDVVVQLVRSSTTAAERAPSFTVQAELNGTAGEVLPVAATVGWFLVEGTATPGEDYVGTGGTVTFPAGAAVGDVVELGPIQILDDDIFEESETFELRIGAFGYSALVRSLTRSTLEIGISDNEGPPAVSVAAASAVEGDDLVFEATLSRPTYHEVASDYAIHIGGSDTATADDDYLAPLPAQDTVRFAPGQTTAQIRIGTVPDGIPEGDETLALVLQNVSAGATIGTGSATGTIRDRVRPGVAATPQQLTVTEGGTAEFRVRLGTSPVGGDQVTATLDVADRAKLALSPASMGFNTFTWEDPVTVTVTAADETPGSGGELDRRDDTVLVPVAASSSVNIGFAPTVSVLVVDDDKAVPGVVGSLGASVGSGRVSLSWAAPVDDGGHDIDGYEYKYFPSDTPAAEQDELFGWNWVPPTSRSVSVEGLANGQEYTFAVRARNQLVTAGDVAPAARVSATPRAGTIVRPNRGGGGGGGGSDVDVGVATFVVANGWSPSDVGVAAVLAARTDNAVTLYTGADVLPEATAALLGDARPAEVLIVGGTQAVSRDVRTQIRQASDGTRTVRITGTDRAATAAAAARRVLGSPATAGRVTLVVANGWSPPDIGAAAALAAAAPRTAVLYTRADALPDASAAVARDYDIARVIVVGGTAAVDDTAAAALSEAAGPDASLTRVTGTDRAATAAAAARRVLGPPAAAAQDVTLVVANGWSPPDIGAAAALAAALDNAAIAYTAADKLPASTEQLIADYQPTAVIIIGGPNAVTDQVRTAITQTAPSDTRIRRITGTDRTHTAANTAKHILRNR